MENRLSLLCDAGVIDEDICRGMLQVVRRLDEEWKLPVHTEQGTMAITHMASALMRSRRGEAGSRAAGGTDAISPLARDFVGTPGAAGRVCGFASCQ